VNKIERYDLGTGHIEHRGSPVPDEKL